MLFLLLAFCSFGLDIESGWAPRADASRGAPRRGRIAHSTNSAHCVFRAMEGFHTAAPPFLAEACAIEIPSAVLIACGLVPSLTPGPAIPLPGPAAATRGPPFTA